MWLRHRNLFAIFRNFFASFHKWIGPSLIAIPPPPPPALAASDNVPVCLVTPRFRVGIWRFWIPAADVRCLLLREKLGL